MSRQLSTPTPGGASLPEPRGPVSSTVVDLLATPPARGRQHLRRGRRFAIEADPFGEDLTLALHLCYELHYHGFTGVAEEWEWSPDLLRLRALLEHRFATALHDLVDTPGDPVETVASALADLLVDRLPVDDVASHLKSAGEWWQAKELFVHRSIYHLKEGDPHAWVIPRLQGRAKAALVAVEFDEYGGGDPRRAHAHLFAELLDAAGLEDGYLHYLHDVPAPAIATVNLMSMFGLHRALRGALVGHLATAEITTGPSAKRMVGALRAMGAPEPCVRFYTEHIEADAVHEQLMRHDVVGDLLDREPWLAADVAFGIQATNLLEGRLTDHLLSSWRAGRSSLRRTPAVDDRTERPA